MAKNETAIVEIVLKGQQANASLKDIEKSARALSAQLKRLPVDSQEFADKTKEFQNINKRLKAIKDDVNGMSGVFSKIGKEIKGFGLLAVGYLGFDWLKSSVTGIIKSNAELSDSLADIRKTTGMTEAEARKLNTAFSQIDTRTTTKELRNIAIAGGQLGIAKGDILGFTVAVDKMNVALGDEFSGGAEEVTKAMGGLRNIFTDIKSNKVDQDLLHIGNAINELASNGAATGPVVSDFANRIGGVGISLGLTSGQVLGLSATLQELNVSTERGGTAITKILQKMTTNTEEFAKVAGIPVKEFTEMVNKDLYGAFVKVVEGSKKGGASATEFGKILNDLGVDGAGASEVFAKLGSNTAMLDDKVKLANTSLKNTDSIMAEFSTKNSTLGAEMERLSKGFASAFTNSTVSDGLKSMVGWMADLFDNTKKVSEGMAEEREQLMMVETEIYSYNVGNENRTKLIKQLQEQYPEYLKNIDAETIGNEDLRKAIDKVNGSLINKLVIQRKDEEIQEIAEEAAEKKIKSTEARIRLIKALSNAYNDNARAMKLQKEFEGVPIEFAAEELLKPENFQKAGLSAYNEKVLEIANSLESWKNAQIEANSASIPLNDALNEKNDLMEQLGIETNNTGTILKKEGESMKGQMTGLASEVTDIRKKLLDDLEKIEQDYNNRGLSGPELEEKAIFDKYQKLIAAEKEGSAVLQRLLFMRQQELDEFYKKQEDKKNDLKIKAERDFQLRLMPELEKELFLKKEQHKKELEEYKKQGFDLTELKKLQQIELDAIRSKYAQKEVADNDTKNKNLSEQDKAYQEKRKATFQDYYQGVSNVLGAWNESQKLQANEEEEAVKAKTSRELQMTNRLFNAKVIGQAEYNRRTKKLEEQQRKEVAAVKKKTADNDKKVAIFNALISGGVAIGRAFADYQYPASLIIAGLVAASTGLNISNIENQKVPEYAKGGLHASGNPQGMVNKPTYFTNSSSGMDFIAGEKGAEWIAPNWMLQNPVTANTIGMLEAIRQRGYANGGLTTTVPIGETKTANSTSSNASYINYSNADLVNAVNTLNGILASGVVAKLSYDQFNKDMSSITSAQQSAQVRN